MKSNDGKPGRGRRERAALAAAAGLAVCFAAGCFLRRPGAEERPVLKVGSLSWTAADLEKEIIGALKGLPVFPVEEELIKKKVLEELVFRSLLKIWAERRDTKQTKQMKALSPEAEARMFLNKLQERLQAAASKKPVKESALRDFYKQNKKSFCRPKRRFLEHILTSRENQARILRRRLLRGEDFEKLAKAHSLAPRQIGYIERGALKIFDEAIDTVKAGAASPPLKSRYGYHIFRPGEAKAAGCLSFKEARGRIARRLKAERARELFQKWIQAELRLSPVFLNEKLLNSLQISYKRRLF